MCNNFLEMNFNLFDRESEVDDFFCAIIGADFMVIFPRLLDLDQNLR